MISPGQTVRLVSRATLDGHPQYLGKGMVIEKVGTIEDFWLVEFLELQLKGSRKRMFVYESDQRPPLVRIK